MCRGLCTYTTYLRSTTKSTTKSTTTLPTIVEQPAFLSTSRTIQKKAATVSNMGSRKQAFLARSMAHRTVSFIEHEVERIVSSSQFLQSTALREDVASLKRSEIELGNMLGQGGFSEVYELNALELTQDASEHDEDFSCEPTSHESQEARERLAEDTFTRKGLVVKHLRKDLLPKRHRFQTAAADLVTEAQFLARLNHPHIIQLRAWAASGISGLGDGEHDGYFLVMDKLDCTLAEKIREWKDEEAYYPQKKASISNLPTKLRYARELASALEYLHERRLVFRDLKPENIGILNDSIVLFDFGLCRELPESENLEDQYEMSGVGTLRYMAPEILMRQPYNQKADTYSFSMVLYEMLFYTKPFELYSFDMLRMLVCEEHERPTIPSHCPLPIRELLEDTWDHNVLYRPTFKIIRKDLQQLMASHHGGWKPRFQVFLEAATLPLLLSKSFSFASSSENTSTTVEESSIGSWFFSS